MTWQVLEADCVEAMGEMDEASVDAIVTDPPYGLEFMGKEWDRLQAPGRDDLRHRRRMDSAPDPEQGNPWASERKSYGTVKKNPRCKRCERLKWDHEPQRCHCEQPDWDLRLAESAQVVQEWHQAWATEALRVLRPGGHLLAAGGTRTFHRLVSAIEDAGFEIRDCIAHMHGSGFPKSLNIGEGRGTALKPSFEPWTLARKPLVGTVRANVERFGTGALNIDATRIRTDGEQLSTPQSDPTKRTGEVGRDLGISDAAVEDFQRAQAESIERTNTLGRWPANVALSHIPPDENGEGGCEQVGERRVKTNVLGKGATFGGVFGNAQPVKEGARDYADPDGLETVEAWECVETCPVRELDRQSGERRSAGEYNKGAKGGPNDFQGPASIPIDGLTAAQYSDSGSASRFFYVAKASRAERQAGLGEEAGVLRNQHPT